MHRQIAGYISMHMVVGQSNKGNMVVMGKRGNMVDMGNRGNMGNLGNQADKKVHSCRKRQGLVCVI